MKKILFAVGFGVVLACQAWGQERLRVTAATAEVRSRPEGGAPVLGRVEKGTILFPSGAAQSGWVPVDPPGDVAMWVNKEFIEGTRVLARTVQLRTGPGLEYDVAGVLSRGDTVMVLEGQGDWLKIAPPSAAQVWVSRADVEAVAESVAPIHEVAEVGPGVVAGGTGVPWGEEPVSWGAPAEPAPAQVAAAPQPLAPMTPPVLPLSPAVSPPRTAPSAPTSMTLPPAHPAPVAHPVQPAVPPATPTPVARPVQPAAVRPASPHPAPVARLPVVSRPTARPTARPGVAPVPAQRPVAQSPVASADPRLVGELHLRAGAAQGRPVRVTGELRNAPFSKGSPSHFRLMPRRGASGDAECLVHGRSEQLRPYVGKPVAIRGQAYAVEENDLPVVVVIEVKPAAP